jgi:antitoxin VapB
VATQGENMVLNIRNPEADLLARRLAAVEKTTVTEAVINALQARLNQVEKRETPIESAERIAKEMGLTLNPNRKPVSPEVYHEFDHDYFANENDVR